MDEQERKQFYNQVATRYDKCAVEETGYSAYLRVPKRIVELLNKKDATVLDLGCGTGLSSTLFFEAGYKVTGIDFSEGMIEVAAARPFHKLICQNLAQDFDVPDSSFDAAVALGVMEFIEDVPQFLARIRAKLRPGGYCGIAYPQPNDDVTSLEMFNHTSCEFARLSNNAGFELLESDQFFGWESGHLGKLVGFMDDPQLRVDYGSVILQKPV